MVPAVLPAAEESSDDELEVQTKPSPPVFDVSFFNRKASLVIKVCFVQRSACFWEKNFY